MYENKNLQNTNGGYIALISVIVISALLIAITFTLSFTGFFLRFNILDYENKNQSVGLAEACVDTTLFKLSSNPSYTGNEDISLGTNTCHIGSISNSGSQFSFKTQSAYPPSLPQKTYTNVSIVANTSDLSIVSWDETPN